MHDSRKPWPLIWDIFSYCLTVISPGEGGYLDILFIAVAGVFEENRNIAYSLHLNCITICECELY